MEPTVTVRLVADPYPPYQFEEEGTIKGVDHDVVAAALKDQGLTVEIKLLSWDDCLTVVDDGRVEGIFQIQPTPKREEIYAFSEPLRQAKTVLFCSRENPIDLTGEIDLAGRLASVRLGAVTGYTYHPIIDAVRGPGRVEVADQQQLITGLAHGDFDLAPADLGVGLFLAGRLGLGNLAPAPGFEAGRWLAVAFRKDRPDLALAFDAGLKRIKQRGLDKKIMEIYGLSL
jgi:polar amino acid transport system substrate-binding protein